ncbi:MAG: hypothetical protein HQL31_11430, partial [Planctomycetes bacterium]|nr:hypothetical protein [Planctomycetota bacterium]
MSETGKDEVLDRYHALMAELRAYPEARLIAVSKRQPEIKIAWLCEAGQR